MPRLIRPLWGSSVVKRISARNFSSLSNLSLSLRELSPHSLTDSQRNIYFSLKTRIRWNSFVVQKGRAAVGGSGGGGCRVPWHCKDMRATNYFATCTNWRQPFLLEFYGQFVIQVVEISTRIKVCCCNVVVAHCWETLGASLELTNDLVLLLSIIVKPILIVLFPLTYLLKLNPLRFLLNVFLMMCFWQFLSSERILEAIRLI